MTLKIRDMVMTSDVTGARAELVADDGRGVWIVSTCPGRLFDRNQAISAMRIEEEKIRPEPDQVLIASLGSELR